MLLTGCISEIGQIKCDEVWCIVRNLKGGFPHSDVPIKHVPELSPSEELYSASCRIKKAFKWTQKRFDEWFTPAFLEEMENSPGKDILDRLAEESESKDILCVCFCSIEGLCHRSLVKKLVKERQKKIF